MRLIDADREKMKYPWKDDALYALRNGETVEAIPVEFIKTFENEFDRGEEVNAIMLLERLISKWRKENERV